MSTPSTAQIRAAIKAKLEAVSGIGKVNDYERFAREQSRLKTLYVDQPGTAAARVKGWFVALRSTEEISPGNGRYQVTHGWEIRGYMSLDDADESEKLFDDLIEAVRDAFRTDEDLGALVSSTNLGEGDDQPGPSGVQLEEKLPVLFCDVLCHSARLKLFTRHYL